MDGWIDWRIGWIEGWMDERMDGRVDRWVDGIVLSFVYAVGSIKDMDGGRGDIAQ